MPPHIMCTLCTESCKVYCCEDGRTHVVSVRSLEPEDSDDLSESHLVKGNTLLWKVKGKKYTTTLLEIYGIKQYKCL